MSRSSEFLLAQFNQRKAKNPRYSQRAFARLLGVNPGRVTQYFAGERPITATAAQKMSEKLGLDKEQQAYFCYLTEIDKKSRSVVDPRILRDDELALVVEWYHFAVLSLISTKDFRLDSEWISRRLGIPTSIVESSLQRLERLKFITIEDGKALVEKGPIATSSDVPNEFLRLSHQDALRHIVDNISAVAVEKRDLSSITLAVDEKKLPEAKQMIRTFRRKLANFLSQGKKSQVYMINVQLFPLSKEN
ncbi:TIGR02147 family protein [Bdellovibrio sp. BCCA]|uniref:TIGR02147 family protein n=1 Tax=Bdellovibrio sp. BCCA TaxID=3136281 RepID=UPI0030F0E4F1